jgi:serine phosphatase RsbU (regulator of sigma subunit)
MFQSLRSQILFFTCSLVILLVSSFTGIAMRMRLPEINREISLEGIGFAKKIFEEFRENFPPVEEDKEDFSKEIKRLVNETPSIGVLEIVRADGQLIFDSSRGFLQVSEEISESWKEAFQKGGSSLVLARSEKVISFADAENKDLASKLIWPFHSFSDDREFGFILTLSYKQIWPKFLTITARFGVLAFIALLLSLFAAHFFAQLITTPLFRLKRRAEEVAGGNLDLEEKYFAMHRNDEIGSLGRALSEMMNRLRQSRQHLLEKERQDHEISLALEIQKNLLPEPQLIRGNLDIAAHWSPADVVGGDFYDFFDSKTGRLTFFVGDAVGHGIPASFLSNAAAMLMRSLEFFANSALELMVPLNATLFSRTKPGVFLTLAGGLWDQENSEMELGTAGGEAILLHRKETRVVEEPASKGVPLGALPNELLFKKIQPFEKVPFNDGDTLLCFTDGISESMNADGEMFGHDRLRELFAKLSRKKNTSAEIIEEILKEVDKFRGSVGQKDDVTLLLLRRDDGLLTPESLPEEPAGEEVSESDKK